MSMSAGNSDHSIENYDLRKPIEDLRRAILLAQGELKAVNERKEKLEKDVGEAKWRELQKPKVEQFLEELLEAAHQKRIGSFARLLSALVAEVMPGESPISMELSIQRNQPWLDIVSQLGPNETEDIFEDQGGALTNVIVLGLRLAAIAKARARRVVFLDESDCWVENHRIPSFYNVLADASEKIGFQCFAISHHDISVFEKKDDGGRKGIAVARLYGHPKEEGGAHVQNAPRYRWSDNEVGIRWIKLINIQGFHNETIHLHPGITALTGPNNHGKSTIMRVMRAIFFDGGRNGLISKGAGECSVEISFEKGKLLRWTRNPKANPIERWQLIGPDGNSVSEDGKVFDTGGKTVPDWVHKISGIGPIEGHDPQVINQKTPVFLLDKPGSVRATVLSIGQETSHIQAMIKLQKERSAEDKKLIKEGEREMADVLVKISQLQQITQLEDQVNDVERFGQEIEEHRNGINAAAEIVHGLTEKRQRLAALYKSQEAMQSLPETEDWNGAMALLRASFDKTSVAQNLSEKRQALIDISSNLKLLEGLPEAMPALTLSREMTETAERLYLLRKKKSANHKMIEALESLPANMVAITRTEEKSGIYKRLEELRARQATVQSQTLKTKADLDKTDELLQAIVANMGNFCPLCGSHVEDHHVFVGHNHGATN